MHGKKLPWGLTQIFHFFKLTHSSLFWKSFFSHASSCITRFVYGQDCHTQIPPNVFSHVSLSAKEKHYEHNTSVSCFIFLLKRREQLLRTQEAFNLCNGHESTTENLGIGHHSQTLLLTGGWGSSVCFLSINTFWVGLFFFWSISWNIIAKILLRFHKRMFVLLSVGGLRVLTEEHHKLKT